MSCRDRYLQLLESIADGAEKYCRALSDITLVVVSKGRSVEQIASVYEAGCRTFGESRWQESLKKIDLLPKDIQWHFIGTLQKNKVDKVSERFSAIHSVDTLDLAKKISERSQRLGMATPLFLQVNSSREKTKHGMTPDFLRKEFEQFLTLPSIKICGLMTIAPMTREEKTVRHAFSSLRMLLEELQKNKNTPKHFKELSMGMSNDYLLALAEGATFLRIGSLVFS